MIAGSDEDLKKILTQTGIQSGVGLKWIVQILSCRGKRVQWEIPEVSVAGR